MENIDEAYRDDHDYCEALKNFKRKDMLLLALYREWVKRRYTKPKFYRTLGVSIVGIFFASLALTYKMKDEPVAMTLMLINSVLLLLLAFSAWVMQKKNEDSEVAKLNAIREAIDSLSK